MAQPQPQPQPQPSCVSAQTETLSHVLTLVEAFRAFDGDDDGQIMESELGGLLRSLGYSRSSDQDVKEMMQEGDKNGDGLLSIDEFLAMNTKEMELGELGESLEATLQALDMDGDELVTGEELFEWMCQLGVEQTLEACREIVAAMDVDGDGAVSFDDFRLILNSLLN